jgi:hypothetical protein
MSPPVTVAASARTVARWVDGDLASGRHTSPRRPAGRGSTGLRGPECTKREEARLRPLPDSVRATLSPVSRRHAVVLCPLLRASSTPRTPDPGFSASGREERLDVANPERRQTRQLVAGSGGLLAGVCRGEGRCRGRYRGRCRGRCPRVDVRGSRVEGRGSRVEGGRSGRVVEPSRRRAVDSPGGRYPPGVSVSMALQQYHATALRKGR